MSSGSVYERGVRGWRLGGSACRACGSKPVDPDAQYSQTLSAAARRRTKRSRAAESARPRHGWVSCCRFGTSRRIPITPCPHPSSPSAHEQGFRCHVHRQDARHGVVGLLEFTLKGHKLTLGAFVEAGQTVDRLFVPFHRLTTAPRPMPLDATSRSTGLRWRVRGGLHRAFHPFCYYNADYDCPYPQRRIAADSRSCREKLAESVTSAVPHR